jgi:predicted RNase H-like HicB family nuclease
MKDNYTFLAVFHIAKDGISIVFPDLPGCLPSADNMEEAFRNAKEALQLHLFGMEEDSETIPPPTHPDKIKIGTHEVLTLINAWMPPFREKMLNKAMNKTVTIPRWLNTLAEKEEVNYSHVLQEALKNYLGVNGNGDLHYVCEDYLAVKDAQTICNTRKQKVLSKRRKHI